MKDAIAEITPVQSASPKNSDLPARGSMLDIKGVMFEVLFVDYKREEMRVRVVENYKLLGNGKAIKINPKKLG
jgi:hypothetical protein